MIKTQLLTKQQSGPTTTPGRGPDASTSVRKASITAGAGLLLMSVLSGIGYLVAVKGLTVPGNATRTAEKIAAHEDLFRFGIVSLFVVAALDVVVAWALYQVFTPVSEAISKLAAGLRIAYAGIFVIAISRLVGVLGLLGTNQQPAAVLGRINSFTNIWDAGLVLSASIFSSSPTWRTVRAMCQRSSECCSPLPVSATCSTA
jgi:hypothetical protein